MTAKSSQVLADALHAAGFADLALRAERDEFHDFLSPHNLPQLTLDHELIKLIKPTSSAAHVLAVRNLQRRLRDGDFDATHEEADEAFKPGSKTP